MATHKCNWAEPGDEDDRKSCRVARVCTEHDEEACDQCDKDIKLRMIHDGSLIYLVNDKSTGFNPGF
jgi:hypothetical protein